MYPFDGGSVIFAKLINNFFINKLNYNNRLSKSMIKAERQLENMVIVG